MHNTPKSMDATLSKTEEEKHCAHSRDIPKAFDRINADSRQILRNLKMEKHVRNQERAPIKPTGRITDGKSLNKFTLSFSKRLNNFLHLIPFSTILDLVQFQ